MKKYARKSGLYFVNSEDDTALFYYFGNRLLIKAEFFRTPLFQKIFDLLEMPVTVTELVKSSHANESEVLEILEVLKENFFLEEVLSEELHVDECLSQKEIELKSFFECFCVTKNASVEYLNSLKSKTLAFVDYGYIGQSILTSLCELPFAKIIVYSHTDSRSHYPNNLKFSFVEDLNAVSKADLVVSSATWNQKNRLWPLNDLFLKTGTPWLSTFHDFYGGTIGPLFSEPGQNFCFNCLVKRQEMNTLNIDKQKLFESFFEATDPEYMKNSSSQFVASLNATLITEILKIVTGFFRSQTYQGLYEFDFFNHRKAFHHIYPLPSCTHCSPAKDSPYFNLNMGLKREDPYQ